jgi:hypothetical protein
LTGWIPTHKIRSLFYGGPRGVRSSMRGPICSGQ